MNSGTALLFLVLLSAQLMLDHQNCVMTSHREAQTCPRMFKLPLGCLSQWKNLLVWVEYYTKVRIQIVLDLAKPSNPLSTLSSNWFQHFRCFQGPSFPVSTMPS